MGAHSTMDITRADALAVLQRALAKATDRELEAALFALVGDKAFYNFHIVAMYSGSYLQYEGGGHWLED